MPTTLIQGSNYLVEQVLIYDGTKVWQVTRDSAKRFSFSGLTLKEAVEKAKEIATKCEGSFTVYNADGSVKYTKSCAPKKTAKKATKKVTSGASYSW